MSGRCHPFSDFLLLLILGWPFLFHSIFGSFHKFWPTSHFKVVSWGVSVVSNKFISSSLSSCNKFELRYSIFLYNNKRKTWSTCTFQQKLKRNWWDLVWIVTGRDKLSGLLEEWPFIVMDKRSFSFYSYFWENRYKICCMVLR